MMNCFCKMVEPRKDFKVHFKPGPLSEISDAPRAGFESAKNLSFGLVE